MPGVPGNAGAPGARALPDFMTMKLFTDGHYCLRSNPLVAWRFGLNNLLPEQERRIWSDSLALRRWQRRLARRLAQCHERLELLHFVGCGAIDLYRKADWYRQTSRAVELAGPCPWSLVTDPNDKQTNSFTFAHRKFMTLRK